MYSRSQPCTVSDKLAPARSIVGSYIYPGDETHTYLCMSVHTHLHTDMHTSMHARACRGVEGWRGQLLAGEVQRRRGEPTVTQFTVIHQLQGHRVSAATTALICPSRTMRPTAGRAGWPCRIQCFKDTHQDVKKSEAHALRVGT